MKAEDTVMSLAEIWDEYESWLDRDCDAEYQEKAVAEVAKAQAEISFNAGIKEVIEWINDNPVFVQSNSLGIKVPISIDNKWQSKLKEWGIE